jgi:hypothetical protein
VHSVLELWDLATLWLWFLGGLLIEINQYLPDAFWCPSIPQINTTHPWPTNPQRFSPKPALNISSPWLQKQSHSVPALLLKSIPGLQSQISCHCLAWISEPTLPCFLQPHSMFEYRIVLVIIMNPCMYEGGYELTRKRWSGERALSVTVHRKLRARISFWTVHPLSTL